MKKQNCTIGYVEWSKTGEIIIKVIKNNKKVLKHQSLVPIHDSLKLIKMADKQFKPVQWLIDKMNNEFQIETLKNDYDLYGDIITYDLRSEMNLLIGNLPELNWWSEKSKEEMTEQGVLFED